MNTYEFLILELNWDDLRKRFANVSASHDFSLSDNCYVVFGTCGVSVFKCKGRKWYRITVNNWKSLSFLEFSKLFRQQQWEAV